MLLHAREGHVEFVGKLRNRSVCSPEMLQNAAPGGVRERGERGIEAGLGILNHVVQYLTQGLAACKERPGARLALPAAFTSTRRSPGPQERGEAVTPSRLRPITIPAADGPAAPLRE